MDIYKVKISNFAILDAYAKALGYVNASTLVKKAGISNNTSKPRLFLPLITDKSIIEKTIDGLLLDEATAKDIEYSKLLAEAHPSLILLQDNKDIKTLCSREERVLFHPVFVRFYKKELQEYLRHDNTLGPDIYKEVTKHKISVEDGMLYEEQGVENNLLSMNGYRYYHLDRTYCSRSFVVENLELGFRCITPKSVDQFIEIEDGKYAVVDSDCHTITIDWLSDSEAEIFSEHFKVIIKPKELGFIKRIH